MRKECAICKDMETMGRILERERMAKMAYRAALQEICKDLPYRAVELYQKHLSRLEGK